MSNVHKTLDEIIASVDQVFKKQELIDKMEDGTLSLEEVRALQSILIQRKHMFDNLLTILNTLVPPREG
jgi:small-conductance mechanosensitive channel